MPTLEDNLKNINAKYVRISYDAQKKNNSMLHKVLSLIIENMKRDKLFEALYNRSPCYTGSYYDGLKVSEPNEYDINILLDLPKLSSPDLNPSIKPGYVSVAINLSEVERQGYLENYRGLKKLIDESNYLDISRVNQWFEGLVQKVVNDLTLDGIYLMTKNGPAKTISVFIIDENIKFDIDLVPCFFFTSEYWPAGYKQNNINNGFFIVPKPLKFGNNRMWRASFQNQEKEIIKNLDKIKPALRLIKVLRDKQENLHALKSYFIKTVFLWEIEDNESNYKSRTLSSTYIEMLRKLQNYVEREEIEFYWNKNLNLLEDCTSQCSNISYRLRNIIKDIERDSNNVWKYYDSTDLPPSYDEATSGNTSQETATVDNNWALVGGVIAGVAAVGIGALLYGRNRQRNN